MQPKKNDKINNTCHGTVVFFSSLSIYNHEKVAISNEIIRQKKYENSHQTGWKILGS
jgi:archaellum biogenesis protein FlaJ (TadC family)